MSHSVLVYRQFDPFRYGPPETLVGPGSFTDLGHTLHCAARLEWGDGLCECGEADREEREREQQQPEWESHEDRSDIWDADQGYFE